MPASRRALLGVTAIAAAGVAGAAWWRFHAAPLDPRWAAYKTRFLKDDGRIVDTGNKNVSHSEGQGYGLLFAVAFNDRPAFDRIHAWTEKALARPDGLHAWRYVPDATPPVADSNNASDGDLLMCWALLRASRKWQRPADDQGFRRLAGALKGVVSEAGDDAYLLPGEVGFTGEGRRVVNLSYWIFPALRDIAAATGDPIWNRLIATGHRLVERARFGARQLPSDWLETNGDLRPAESFPPRFGYDAVRVPLNLVWGGMATADRLEPIARAWSSFGREVPAWIDVMTDQVSPEFQSPGMQAVARLTLAAAQGRRLSDADLPSLDAAQDYYAASLLMQCYLAATEMDAGHVS